MLYRPNYCCNCGERIERSEWRVWDSRRFCPLCETEYKGHDLFTRAIVGIGVVLGIFGFSSILKPVEFQTQSGSQHRQILAPPPQEQVKRPSQLRPNLPADQESKVEAVPTPIHETPTRLAGTNSGQTAAAKKSSQEPVYFCGVTTKKGTPCSRRVKTKGKPCWQHAAAILE